MTERTTVRLPEPLLAAARKRAAAEGRTLTSLIEEGLRTVVGRSSSRRKRPVDLPVSRQTGGIFAGIDLAKTARLLELDDLASLSEGRSQKLR